MQEFRFPKILGDFDFKLLEDSEFKEDSVREEIILPIIKELNYTSSKPHQIIRSRNLSHPFVSIGSQSRKINIVPDYLFEVNGKPAWILDAKSPSEVLTKSKHVEQAYSYAIHPEVRVNYYALCNGKEFVLYHINELKPILHFNIIELSLYIEELKKFLLPENVLKSDNKLYKKDLGLHLKRLGFKDYILLFRNVPITSITQLDPNMLTFGGTIELENDKYVASFDFNENILHQLNEKIPNEAINKLKIRNTEHRIGIKFPDRAFLVDVECKIGEDLQENDKEIFQPLIVTNFI